MDNKKYKCEVCGGQAECAEIYSKYNSTGGCADTDYRYLCKDCLFGIYGVGVHSDNHCTHCGKELDFSSDVYSQPCGLYCSFECMMHDIHAVYPLNDLE